jgi:sensor histidine kinase YesM
MKIHTKLLLFILLIVVSLNSVAFFLYQSSRIIQSSYSEIIERFLLLNEVSNVVEENLLSLNNYLINGDPLLEIVLQEKRNELISLREKLNSFVVREDNEMNLRNYRSMLDTFLSETQFVVEAREAPGSPGYADHHKEAEKIAGYIAEETRRLINLELNVFHPAFQGMTESHQSIHAYGIGIFLVSTILVVVFALWFSKGVTEPISRLVRSAHRLSLGDFRAKDVAIASKDEIGVLGEAFNSMQNSIKKLIDEIKEKADLEKALQEQALKNMEMDRTMKALELKGLQSQINPHFLFNTLNTLSKLAYIEGAEKASDLITSVSKLLRYNLGKLDRPATLAMELDQIKEYLKIQKTRFRDRVHFVWDIDESCLDLSIPCLTLQPIVENAFIHGIDSLQSGAVISISIRRSSFRVHLEVRDNGVGIPPEKIRRILSTSAAFQSEPGEGHTTGLGLYNVATRLRLYYNEPYCMNIVSSPDRGTSVMINVPYGEEEVDNHAQAVNR